MVEVYERGGKSVIAVCEETSGEGYHLPGALNGLEKDLKTLHFSLYLKDGAFTEVWWV